MKKLKNVIPILILCLAMGVWLAGCAGKGKKDSDIWMYMMPEGKTWVYTKAEDVVQGKAGLDGLDRFVQTSIIEARPAHASARQICGNKGGAFEIAEAHVDITGFDTIEDRLMTAHCAEVRRCEVCAWIIGARNVPARHVATDQ